MKAYGPYLKIATLLAGIFWLWDWGHEGSETLSPCAFALADYSSVPGADGSTCGAIRDSIRRIAIENRFFSEYVPGQIIILLKEDDGISEAILAASQAEESVTGIASFDSVSSLYGLSSIWSSFNKRRFVLIFSGEADLVPIVRAYEDLPYMELVDLNTIYNIPPEFPSEEPLDIWDQAYAPWEIEILLKDDDEISAAIFASSQTAEQVTGITSFDSVSSLYGLICLHSIHESSSFYKRKFTLIFPLESSFGDDPFSIVRAYGDLPYIERVTFSQYRTPIEEPSAILDQSWGRIKAYRRKKGEHP